MLKIKCLGETATWEYKRSDPAEFLLFAFDPFCPPDYWGAYIPLLPLVLSLVGLALCIQKKADPAGTDNDRAAPGRV